ncbi:hypothetical protein [Candidatus Phytoplasma melaleucae]|uniref:Effector n=1 Tax=Candidatus Phytoplasma melaleucae TaxID=2982630 RepID=A0ABT9DDH8_9MOLU|nr:hypothetical protein ['Melaleuca sp.' phytoplasma]MDO8168090.1 hypothetical protein ['Melaleuca sp.' phytoplasma]MDV3205370.1 hypothetical protein [Weeping tea tree witches'-broom phytoplasma]
MQKNVNFKGYRITILILIIIFFMFIFYDQIFTKNTLKTKNNYLINNSKFRIKGANLPVANKSKSTSNNELKKILITQKGLNQKVNYIINEDTNQYNESITQIEISLKLYYQNIRQRNKQIINPYHKKLNKLETEIKQFQDELNAFNKKIFFLNKQLLALNTQKIYIDNKIQQKTLIMKIKKNNLLLSKQYSFKQAIILTPLKKELSQLLDQSNHLTTKMLAIKTELYPLQKEELILNQIIKWDLIKKNKIIKKINLFRNYEQQEILKFHKALKDVMNLTYEIHD